MVSSLSSIWRWIICFSALIEASTGPLPVAAASNTSLAIFSLMAAIGVTPLPDVTCSDSICTRFSVAEVTPARTSRSSSPNCFFLSAISRNFWYILSRCSWSFISMPRMCRRCFRAARPERAVSTIALSSMPTSLGSIIS